MPQKNIPVDVQKLLEEASKNTQPKKHHLVPASYLERWAVDGNVRVHQLDQSRSHLARPTTAARQTDYYLVQSKDLDPADVPPMIFETILSRVEGPAVRAIDELVAMPDLIDGQVRYDVATFMAFQSARGHRSRLRIRAMANELVKLQTRELTDDHIRQMLAEDGSEVMPEDVEDAKETIRQLQDGDLYVVPQDAQAIAFSFAGAQLAARVLFERAWVVCSTAPNLITTDEPVLSIGGPGSPRTESSGVGSAAIVAFPLSPKRVLLAVRRDLADLLGLPVDVESVANMRLDLVETIELSRELVMSATRWAFERADRNVIEKLSIPARPEDVSIEEYLSEAGDSSLIRHFNFTRWHSADLVPDWPIGKLWPPGWRSLPLPESLGDELESYRQDEEALHRDGEPA